MNFVTFQFILFFLISFLVFIFLNSQQRKYFVLLASYFFYGTWSIPLISVILLSTTVDYWLGNKIFKSDSLPLKKIVLTTSIVINCSILIFFKYTNFLLGTAHAMGTFFGYVLPIPKSFYIILPLGVSFYTFEAISYIVDIYRGEKPASSWLNYNFYIMYFPHLISGPIVRYKELHEQYERSISLPEFTRLNEGLRLVLYGFIFKLIIADSAATFVDPIFNNYQHATHIEAWLASLGFTVQIYFDFLGYTHIARGVSLFFNIQLPLNFNHPYHARNISEFWQRWHISLSRWIRDYLYIPLGGNRGGFSRTINNLLLTMFIAGLWHGASWNYAIWGLYHGGLLGSYHLYRRYQPRQSERVIAKITATIFTYTTVVIGWVIFRSTSMDQARTILTKMYDLPGFMHEIAINSKMSVYTDSFLTIAILAMVCFIGPMAKSLETKILMPIQPLWVKKCFYSLASFVLLIFMFSPTKPFIYFVF